MKNKPSIETAKTLAKKHEMDGVVIFFSKGGKFGFVSYGKNRQQCQRFGEFADKVADKIESEEIIL